jgi:hypothetical protein
MNEASATYLELFKLASQLPEVRESVKCAQSGIGELLRNPRVLGALGLAGVGVGVPAYLAGRSSGRSGAEEAGKQTRNLAFAGGLASGLAAPKVLKALGLNIPGLGLTGDVADSGGEFQEI